MIRLNLIRFKIIDNYQIRYLFNGQRLKLSQTKSTRYLFNFSNNVNFHHKFQTRNSSNNSSSNLAIEFETGVLELNHKVYARLADSSATGRYNDTNVLVTVVNKSKQPPASFLPLTVDYVHKASAAGKIPTNFHRRDMGASNYEILVARMIDRSIRPLFSNNYNLETQIICNLLAYDGRDSSDVLCINTVSYALHGSNCEWNGPIGCVRVGLIDNKFVVNPNRKQLESSPLNLVISVGPNKNIVMIEAWGDNLEQSKFISALEYGALHAFKVVESIKAKKLEKTVKEPKLDKSVLLSITSEDYPLPTSGSESEATSGPSKSESKTETIKAKPSSSFVQIEEMLQSLAYSKLYDILTDYEHDKLSRDNAITQLKNLVINSILKGQQASNDSTVTYASLNELFYKYVKKGVRELVMNESKRVDGRKLDELRQISCKVDLFNSLHGSATFQRGQTQVLCSVTFDSPDAMYKSDAIVNMMSPSLTNFNKNFMLHYEFPAFATNEIARVGGRADRREIGHGALAEKALYPLLPTDYPFTVRCLCEVLESNGSSSMASVCAGSMALMDAGVPLKEHVCGVAMGIFANFDEKTENVIDYKILTDISGFEDYMGDMDFKIAGTKTGITAVQADFKIVGLPIKIVKEIVEKSKTARHKIIKLMSAEIMNARNTKKPNQPVLKNLSVQIDQRAKLLGTGGINLKRIYAKTGVTINTVDENNFNIFAPNENSLKEAEEMIKCYLEQSREPVLEFGGVYKAKVVEIVAGGLMVQLYPTMKPTLLPNNQLDGRKISHGSVSDYKIGQEIQVKYFGRDPADGKMRISRKALFKTISPAVDLINR